MSKVAISGLNARTVDILNTIRANASAQYQSQIPQVTVEHDIPKVGEILYGYPALANEFVGALVNRIAAVKVNNATFQNDYADLKKGYLPFGSTVEEVFVNICKAREFSAEKAAGREFKRTLPDVKSAFHTMNWKVQYPITIQNEDLRMAFTSFSGVEDLIARIIDAVTTAAEYDEFLLFKYLIIKAVAHGKMYPVEFDATDMKTAAKTFRGMSNQLTFMSTKYNAAGVTTTTGKNDQYIFMDAQFNAGYDVDVLASAFNMDKATFMGKLKLIDDFTTFDNDRFDVIRAGSDQIEEVTSDELAIMANVKAILLDREWFQIYDNLNQMSEQYVANGLYWNYFYNVWKTVSSSPFSNAIVFVDDAATTTVPATFDVEVTAKDVSDAGTILTLTPDLDETLVGNVKFVYNQNNVTAGVAIHPYGAIILPADCADQVIDAEILGTAYTSGSVTKIGEDADVGDKFTFTKAV